MHGFNRLGGNSLAETLVAGRIVGKAAAAAARGGELNAPTGLAREFLERDQARIADWLARTGEGPSVYALRDRMGEAMINQVGIFRNGPDLAEGVETLQELLAEVDRAVLACRDPGVNPELSFALRLKGMLRLAYVTARGAQARTESRGAHCRTDYPERDDSRWLNRTLVRWGRDESEPSFSYEPVGLLDLPPGHRGYGQASNVPMAVTLDEYNETVLSRQREHGMRDTQAPHGAELRPGAWKDAEARAGLKTIGAEGQS
jgi:fumarate reductase flavoprotein subunit